MRLASASGSNSFRLGNSEVLATLPVPTQRRNGKFKFLTSSVMLCSIA